MSDFLQTVRDRVVVYDGAMGTNIQVRNPTLDDYWGKENCSEVLVLSRPDIIRDIHADFFKVGCDVVETNTFGGTSLVLREFDLEDRVAEINIAAAKLAREVAQQFSTKERPRFVAGSMGPTTKLPSLGHISFDEMVASYEQQATALIEGGVVAAFIGASLAWLIVSVTAWYARRKWCSVRRTRNAEKGGGTTISHRRRS